MAIVPIIYQSEIAIPAFSGDPFPLTLTNPAVGDATYELGTLPFNDTEGQPITDLWSQCACFMVAVEMGGGPYGADIRATVKIFDGEELYAEFGGELHFAEDVQPEDYPLPFNRFLRAEEFVEANPDFPIVPEARNPWMIFSPDALETGYAYVDGRGSEPLHGGVTNTVTIGARSNSRVCSPWFEMPIKAGMRLEATCLELSPSLYYAEGTRFAEFHVGFAVAGKPLPFFEPIEFGEIHPLNPEGHFYYGAAYELATRPSIAEMGVYIEGERQLLPLPIEEKNYELDMAQGENDVYIYAIDSDGRRGWQKIVVEGENQKPGAVVMPDGARILASQNEQTVEVRRIPKDQSTADPIVTLENHTRPRLTARNGQLTLLARNNATKQLETLKSPDGGQTWQ